MTNEEMKLMKTLIEARDRITQAEAERDRMANEVKWLRQQLEQQHQLVRFRDRMLGIK